MKSNPDARLKPGVIRRLLNTDHVSTATREALRVRLKGPLGGARCLEAAAFSTLAAVAARLIPQPKDRRRIDLAARFDARVAEGAGDGWRYDCLPPDREAMTRGFIGIERTAQARFGVAFCALEGERQDDILSAVQKGEADAAAFEGLVQARFFEEVLAGLTELYFSHPHAYEQIGFVGLADTQGFQALGLNTRDPIEDEASLAPL